MVTELLVLLAFLALFCLLMLEVIRQYLVEIHRKMQWVKSVDTRLEDVVKHLEQVNGHLYGVREEKKKSLIDVHK